MHTQVFQKKPLCFNHVYSFTAFWMMKMCSDTIMFKEEECRPQTPWEHTDLIKHFNITHLELHGCFGRRAGYKLLKRKSTRWIKNKKNPDMFFPLALITTLTSILTLQGFVLSALYNPEELVWNVVKNEKGTLIQIYVTQVCVDSFF